MTYLSEAKLRILRALRHGALNLPEIGQETGMPMFTAHAELKALKRARLVSDGFEARGHVWELTVRGCGLAWSSEQIAIDAS